MSSLRLPQPTRKLIQPESKPTGTSLKLDPNLKIPPYGQRDGWIPRAINDFGDGGAFPEIHVAQYPLDMGRKGSSNNNTNKALAVRLDSDGKVKYDALVSTKGKVVYASLKDTQAKTGEIVPLKPSEEEVDKTTEATRLALEKLTQGKIEAALPVRRAESTAPASYVRYTPSGANEQRVIRMIEVQKDPLEPPKFRINKKIPQAPPSPPPPVLHSPTRKVTVQEQQDWKIPPCVSNWKNAKGYTIPLDKRLAADGRGLQKVEINDKFARMAEALYIADRKAREEVELRAQMEKKLAQKEKERKEEGLRLLARKAREQRAGITSNAPSNELDGDEEDDELVEREAIRRDRHKERQRERNLAKAAPDKRDRLARERERDITEQIALGTADPGQRTSELQYDQRLFDQSKGLGTGFGDDEDYTVYDRPWRGESALAKNVYRPTRGANAVDGDVDYDAIRSSGSRFTSDPNAVPREGPVQFEKEEDDDPLGLGKFLNEAKKASKRAGEDYSSNRASTASKRPR